MSNTMDKIEGILEESFAIATGKTSPDRHIEEAMVYAKKKIKDILESKMSDNTPDEVHALFSDIGLPNHFGGKS